MEIIKNTASLDALKSFSASNYVGLLFGKYKKLFKKSNTTTSLFSVQWMLISTVSLATIILLP